MNKKNIQKYLNILAEPNRLAILKLLKKKERCACEIHPTLKLSQNLTAHHLKVLKDLKLLTNRRSGVKVLYSRNEKVIRDYQLKLNKTII